MLVILDSQGRYRPSQSAPTPGGVSAGNLEKCVTALRRHYRSTRCLTSLPNFTRDASAHESAAVRRHQAPGPLEGWRLLRTVLSPRSRRWSPGHRRRQSHAVILPEWLATLQVNLPLPLTLHRVGD